MDRAERLRLGRSGILAILSTLVSALILVIAAPTALEPWYEVTTSSSYFAGPIVGLPIFPAMLVLTGVVLLLVNARYPRTSAAVLGVGLAVLVTTVLGVARIPPMAGAGGLHFTDYGWPIGWLGTVVFFVVRPEGAIALSFFEDVVIFAVVFSLVILVLMKRQSAKETPAAEPRVGAGAVACVQDCPGRDSGLQVRA